MQSKSQTSVFLSYNSADKDYVRRLAAALVVTGAHLWYDEWVVRPGDSIPGSIDKGLAEFDVFALVWSERASESRWVRGEMEAAVTRWINEQSIRLVPVLLDQTPLPPLLQPIRYIDGRDGDHLRVTRELLGIETETAFRMAVQEFIDDAGLYFYEFAGAGVFVACPQCGASPEHLVGWEEVDRIRGNLYRGARCEVCGWSDGGEVPF